MTIHQTTIRSAATPQNSASSISTRTFPVSFRARVRLLIRAWRDAALDAFIMLGVPHRRVEEWKYTDLRALMPEVHPLGGLTSGLPMSASRRRSANRSLSWTLIGRCSSAGASGRISLTIHDAHGVTFEPLQQALEDDGASAKEITTRSLRQRDVIAALSAAFATDGAILAVAPKTRLEKPVHLIFVSADEKPALYALQHAISIGKEAEGFG